MSLVPIFSRVLNAQYIKNIKFEIVNGYESERTLLGKEGRMDRRERRKKEEREGENKGLS